MHLAVATIHSAPGCISCTGAHHPANGLPWGTPVRSLQDVGCRGEERERAGGQCTSHTRHQGEEGGPGIQSSQARTRPGPAGCPPPRPGCRAAVSDLRPSRAREEREYQDQKLLAGWVRVKAPHRVRFQINLPPQEATYTGPMSSWGKQPKSAAEVTEGLRPRRDAGNSLGHKSNLPSQPPWHRQPVP